MRAEVEGFVSGRVVSYRYELTGSVADSDRDDARK